MTLPQPTTILGGLLLVGAIVMIVALWIVTDEEALENWAEAAENAAEAKDADRLSELMTPDFTFGSRDRETTVREIVRLVRDFGVTSVTVELTGIEVNGDEAFADARLRATTLGRFWEGRTRLRFARFDQGWALAHADPLVEPIDR